MPSHASARASPLEAAESAPESIAVYTMEQSDFVSTDTEESFSFILNQAARAVARDLQARLHPYGVTPAQLNVLSCLWEDDALPANVLAERSGFDAPQSPAF